MTCKRHSVDFYVAHFVFTHKSKKVFLKLEISWFSLFSIETTNMLSGTSDCTKVDIWILTQKVKLTASQRWSKKGVGLEELRWSSKAMTDHEKTKCLKTMMLNMTVFDCCCNKCNIAKNSLCWSYQCAHCMSVWWYQFYPGLLAALLLTNHL